MRVGVQRPRIHLAPAFADSEGPDAVWLASQYGLQADDWQEFLLTDALALSAAGRWAAPRVGWSVPRQNGKNGALEIFELYKMVVNGRRVLHTAHQVKTAMKAFKRLKWFFGSKVADPSARFPDLNAKVIELRNTNGQEAIFLDNGGSFELIARSKASGRGFSADDLVCDEAQDMTDDDYAALLPTISASPDPQIIVTGTPPRPGPATGEVFARFRKLALEGKDPRLAWSEFSCPEDADLDSIESLMTSNPAVGIRLSVDFSADERASMDDETYGRERLGIWATTSTGGLITPEMWELVKDSKSSPVGDLVFAVDAEPDQSSAAIAVAGMNAHGRVHVELADMRPGVSWAAERLIEMYRKHKPRAVVVDSASTAASLIPALEAAHITPMITSAQHMQRACVGFLSAVTDRTLAHTGLEPRLTIPVLAGGKRALGDAWAWKKRGGTNISPLVAVTLAHYGLASKIRNPTRSRVVVLRD